MAYTGFGESFGAQQAQTNGSFRRWVSGLFTLRIAMAQQDAPQFDEPVRRKLAGPDPRDLRARGYMADLDMEMGF